MNRPAPFLGETLFVRLGTAGWEQYWGMKRCIFLLCLVLSLAHPGPAQDGPHREVRLIRRAFLDVTELLPSPEELDWYVVYNRNGYALAAEYLAKKSEGKWSSEQLLTPSYRDAPEQAVPREVLEKNVVYLAGLWRGELSPALFEEGSAKFIKDALEIASENPAHAIDWMVNSLTCRPASAEEENQLSAIFNKVSLKTTELEALRTVLLHIFELRDCKYK